MKDEDTCDVSLQTGVTCESKEPNHRHRIFLSLESDDGAIGALLTPTGAREIAADLMAHADAVERNDGPITPPVAGGGGVTVH